MNIYNKFRPKSFKSFVGNSTVVSSFRKTFSRKNPPNSAIISGPFGVGKTTLARIIKRKLETHDNDYFEMNIASVTGIDNVREIEQETKNPPLFSRYKIFVLDECQKLSKSAQDAILKVLEDCPDYCIFFLCTTEIDKIPKGILSRCPQFVLKPLTENELGTLLVNVAITLEYDLTTEMVKKIYIASEGSPRTALSILESILNIPEKDALDFITSYSESSAEAKELFQKLLKGESWESVASTLKSIKEDHETIRRGCLGYMSAILLNQKKVNNFTEKCALIIEAFEKNWYDEGRAGLVKACYGLSRRV
jgi:DNA polymerase III gamma/tau subunit